jgi:mRNA interferase RelE/StbE
MNLKIFLNNQPKNFFKKQEKIIVKRIFNKIYGLLENPFPSDSKFLKGNEKLFRIRVGDYRILYRVNYINNKLIIFKIEKRSKVYD